MVSARAGESRAPRRAVHALGRRLRRLLVVGTRALRRSAVRGAPESRVGPVVAVGTSGLHLRPPWLLSATRSIARSVAPLATRSPTHLVPRAPAPLVTRSSAPSPAPSPTHLVPRSLTRPTAPSGSLGGSTRRSGMPSDAAARALDPFSPGHRFVSQRVQGGPPVGGKHAVGGALIRPGRCDVISASARGQRGQQVSSGDPSALRVAGPRLVAEQGANSPSTATSAPTTTGASREMGAYPTRETVLAHPLGRVEPLEGLATDIAAPPARAVTARGQAASSPCRSPNRFPSGSLT